MQLFKAGSPLRAARGAPKPIVTVQEPMNWTWTDPFTIRPPSAGQRVTRAVSNHPETPQLSIPIHMFLLQKINEKFLTLQPVCNVSIMLYRWFHDISNGIDLRWKDVMLGFIFTLGFANNSQFDEVYIPVAVVPCSVCNETPWVGLQTWISHLVRVVNNGWTLNSVCPLWKGVCFLWGLVGVLMMPSFLYLFHESDWICLEGGNERVRVKEWKRKKKSKGGTRKSCAAHPLGGSVWIVCMLGVTAEKSTCVCVRTCACTCALCS